MILNYIINSQGPYQWNLLLFSDAFEAIRILSFAGVPSLLPGLTAPEPLPPLFFSLTLHTIFLFLQLSGDIFQFLNARRTGVAWKRKWQRRIHKNASPLPLQASFTHLPTNLTEFYPPSSLYLAYLICILGPCPNTFTYTLYQTTNTCIASL